jgi:hypothetical protein
MNLRILSVGENSAKSNRFLPWRVPAGWPPPEEDGDWAWFLHPETHEWVFTQWLGSLWWKLSKTSSSAFHVGKKQEGWNGNDPREATLAGHRNRRSDPQKDEAFRQQCRLHTLGKVSITNGTDNKFVFPDQIPEGWRLGRTMNGRATKKDGGRLSPVPG